MNSRLAIFAAVTALCFGASAMPSGAAERVEQPLRLVVDGHRLEIDEDQAITLGEFAPGDVARVPVEIVRSGADAAAELTLRVVDIGDGRLGDELGVGFTDASVSRSSARPLSSGAVETVRLPPSGSERAAVTFTLPATAGNELQGASAAFRLQWTVNSGGATSTADVPVRIGDSASSPSSSLPLTGFALWPLLVLGLSLTVIGCRLVGWARGRQKITDGSSS